MHTFEAVSGYDSDLSQYSSLRSTDPRALCPDPARTARTAHTTQHQPRRQPPHSRHAPFPSPPPPPHPFPLKVAILERDTNGTDLAVWSYPGVGAEMEQVLLSRSELAEEVGAPNGAEGNFFFGKFKGQWHYTLTTGDSLPSLVLPKVSSCFRSVANNSSHVRRRDPTPSHCLQSLDQPDGLHPDPRAGTKPPRAAPVPSSNACAFLWNAKCQRPASNALGAARGDCRTPIHIQRVCFPAHSAFSASPQCSVGVPPRARSLLWSPKIAPFSLTRRDMSISLGVSPSLQS